MDPLIIGLIAIIAFLVLISQGVPIAFAFALVGFGGTFLVRGSTPALNSLAQVSYAWATAQALIPVPLFIIMGYLAYASGITQDLYGVAYKWFGKYSGGMAMATTVASTGFAACCGAVPAAAATMATIAYPEMERLKYDRKLSTGCISAGSTISILIPPSIPFLIYAMLAEVSAGDLFIAGILPGILMAGAFLVAIYVMTKRNPALGPRGASFSWKEKVSSLKNAVGMIVLFMLVIGGLYFGIFTPIEAGAIGAFGALVIGLVMRRLNFTKIGFAIKESARLVGFTALLVIGAQVFNVFLGVSGFQGRFTEIITGLTLPSWVILGIVLVVYLLAGMFLDIMAIYMLTIPTLAPIMNILGYDLVWFGVVTIILAQIGFLTPPVGMCSYIVQGVTKVPLEDIFRGVIPFAIVMIIIIVIIIAFPQIALFLPGLTG